MFHVEHRAEVRPIVYWNASDAKTDRASRAVRHRFIQLAAELSRNPSTFAFPQQLP